VGETERNDNMCCNQRYGILQDVGVGGKWLCVLHLASKFLQVWGRRKEIVMFAAVSALVCCRGVDREIW